MSTGDHRPCAGRDLGRPPGIAAAVALAFRPSRLGAQKVNVCTFNHATIVFFTLTEFWTSSDYGLQEFRSSCWPIYMGFSLTEFSNAAWPIRSNPLKKKKKGILPLFRNMCSFEF